MHKRTRGASMAVIALAIAFAWGCGPTNTGGGDVDAPGGGGDATGTDPDANVSTVDAPDVPIDAPALPIDAIPETDAEICGDLTCTNPVNDGCMAIELCDNGTDDNCNGMVDEGCGCTAGAVQQCFNGPPGRRHVGACVDGMQTCQGTGEFREWGPCVGGIAPGAAEPCDSLDNNCNGCVDDNPACCIVELACPAPGSLPDGAPFENYVIDGTQFYGGAVATWAWDVTGGPCDRLFLTTTSPVVQTFTLTGANGPTLTLRPTLSGDYTVHVRITTPAGVVYECTFIVHVAGPGLRIEQCSDRTANTDIDLHLYRSGTTGQRYWFTTTATGSTVNNDDCYYRNCSATDSPAANWGYANSPIAECSGGPEGASWTLLGYCRNPRLDIDSIFRNGTPENINVDTPVNNGTYRVMAHYYSGTGVASPLVNVYCGGRLLGTYGAAPDVVTAFDQSGGFGAGDMWRVVDATPTVVGGVTTGCTLTPLHPPGMTTGYWVTTNDRSY
ncbi:MAG: putative metal-binding motif-containing protein [Myxococcales bacterium]|nr:putative metal-binding motif-containing protein [Myxococcales bacterium]